MGAIVPASAADDSLDINDFSYLLASEAESDSGVTEELYFSVSYEDVTFKGVAMRAFYCEDRSFYVRGRTKVLTAFDVTEVCPGHDYEMDFYTGINMNVSNIGYTVKVTVEGTEIFNRLFKTNNNKDHIKIKFTMPSSVTDSTTVKIEYIVPDRYNFGSEEGQILRYYISREIGFTDTTENPGWLGKILNKFSELGDAIGGFFDGLGERIGGFFSSLSESIGQWFAEQAQKIQDFKDGVKQWFQDLGDRIQQFFIDLYNDIVEGLKKLFIPSEGYFDSKKNELETFAVEHFGAMYQAPDVMVDMIRKFTTMSPKQPSITLPAIQFDFQGTRYVLSESVTYSFSWVNDKSHMLYYFYQFYRGFVTVILFLGFANYCGKKYSEVFGGSSE